MKYGLVTTLALLTGIAASAAEWEVDEAHSSAIFRVHHLGAGMVYGGIPDISGTVNFDPANPDNGSVEITINTASVSTWNSGRDNHLRGPDFFNAKEFPTMTFKSTGWKQVDEDTFEVSGDFTLLGQTKEITVEANFTGSGTHPRTGNQIAGFESTFVLDRTDFGMNYGVAETGGLGKEVRVTIAVEAAKQG